MKKIIKALKHCVDKDCEEGCPYDLNGCYGKLADDTITLLTNQKEEIERLQKLLDEKCDIIKEQEAEIERLMNKCEDCAGCSEWKCDCSNIRNYTIEEFAERLKKVGTKVEGRKGFEGVFVMANNLQIDNLAKELTEKG